MGLGVSCDRPSADLTGMDSWGVRSVNHTIWFAARHVGAVLK